jgi:hypothetical protein
MLYAVPITLLRTIYMCTTSPSMICEGKHAREQYAERSRYARGTQNFAREPLPQLQLPAIPDVGQYIYLDFTRIFSSFLLFAWWPPLLFLVSNLSLRGSLLLRRVVARQAGTAANCRGGLTTMHTCIIRNTAELLTLALKP